MNLTAVPVINYTVPSTQESLSYPNNITGLNFCNVSISYTHPGQNDLINVRIWLPSNDWNGRFMGVGGGGYSTGPTSDSPLANGLSLGYSVATTDGGHELVSPTAATWALNSPGNVNTYLLQDFASVALKDMAVIGKAVTESFYQKAPAYSYWNGCSTGGRQGLMMAQRYPDEYDGILAGAPAINWASFIVAEYWPQLIMNLMKSYPSACELNAITAAAVAACDALDGVADGIISRPDLCYFEPGSLTGQSFDCEGVLSTFSNAGTTLAQAAWTGARSTNNSFLWYGLSYGANLTTGLAVTTCTNGTCTGRPFSISSDWISLFVQKNASFDPTTLTRSTYNDVFHASKQQFTSIIDTADPDLSSFRDAGGKVITWHGLSDNVIFPEGTADYFKRVKAMDPDVESYYRHFRAPGVEHCRSGLGPYPKTAFESLVQWVEKGIAPEVLAGESLPLNGSVIQRNLCMYPQDLFYTGGDPNVASSFRCLSSKAGTTAPGSA